jgi:hypothetical protein
MTVAAMSPVWICHTSKCFYLGIDMFNRNTPARKTLVIRLFLKAFEPIVTHVFTDDGAVFLFDETVIGFVVVA